METMNLSDGEKLILSMLCDIYQHLEIKGDIDPSFVRDALIGGHYWAIKEEYRGLLNIEADCPDIVDEVFDILAMWSVLEKSYEQLSDQEKETIKTEAKFPGFDGNIEGPYLAAAEFIVEKMGRFRDFRDRSLNSHFPSLPRHRPMVKALQEMRPHLDGNPLNREQMIAILNTKWSA